MGIDLTTAPRGIVVALAGPCGTVGSEHFLQAQRLAAAADEAKKRVSAPGFVGSVNADMNSLAARTCSKAEQEEAEANTKAAEAAEALREVGKAGQGFERQAQWPLEAQQRAAAAEEARRLAEAAEQSWRQEEQEDHSRDIFDSWLWSVFITLISVVFPMANDVGFRELHAFSPAHTTLDHRLQK